MFLFIFIILNFIIVFASPGQFIRLKKKFKSVVWFASRFVMQVTTYLVIPQKKGTKIGTTANPTGLDWFEKNIFIVLRLRFWFRCQSL